MRKDPHLCAHTDISKSVKFETVSIPELGVEQLVLRVRIFCKDCKEPFIVKTSRCGFSTDEIGFADGSLIIPLERPYELEDDESDMAQATRDAVPNDARRLRDDLH